MRLCPAILCLWTLLGTLHAHDLHQSTGEIEYNPKTQKLEASLTVFISDLELALIRHTEHLISFDKTPPDELDAAIQAYLAKTFVVTDSAGKTAKLDWVGRETEAATAKSGDAAVTLFFEVPLVDGMQGCSLQYAALCELFHDQVNLLRFRGAGKVMEMDFRRGTGPKIFGL